MEITTKYVRNGAVMFVTHEHFAVLFFSAVLLRQLTIFITRIGVRAGGARGAAAPQILGNSYFLGSERKFGQSQFFKTFTCFLNRYFEEINIFYFNLKLA